MCRWVTSAALLLGLATILVSPAAAQNANQKQKYLRVLKEYIVNNTKPRGLSKEYLYLVKDVNKYISALARYLVGVAVDRDYLVKTITVWPTGVLPDPGLTQPKGWKATFDSAASVYRERKYDGWIILAAPIGLNRPLRKILKGNRPSRNDLTLLHESVHVYHLIIGSDDDEDAKGGPYGIEKLAQYLGSMMQADTLHKKLLKRIADDTQWTEQDRKEVEAQRKQIQDNIQRKYKWMRSLSAINEYAFRCLQNIGGRADTKAYRDAVNRTILKAIQAKWRVGRWERCKLGTGVYATKMNKPHCLCAQANRRPQTRAERAALRWILQPSDSKKCIRAR